MRATDRITRRGRDAAASAAARGTLRRNDAGDLVPIASEASPSATATSDATPTEARQVVRQIDGQGWAR
jgi:hypothetical protein